MSSSPPFAPLSLLLPVVVVVVVVRDEVKNYRVCLSSFVLREFEWLRIGRDGMVLAVGA